MRIIGLLLAAVPFAFGALRAASTGSDFRYLWVAVASTIAAATVLFLCDRATPPRAGRVFASLVAATAAACGVAFAQGAESLPAVLVVAFGFALCGSGGLALTSRRRRPQRAPLGTMR